MSLAFGHGDLEPNHIHDIKPLIALLYYQLMVKHYYFTYVGTERGVWRYPEPVKTHWSRRDIITYGFIEKNTQLQLLTHTFDADTRFLRVIIKYVLKCIMKDGTIEYKELDEFSIIPNKIANKIVDGMNIAILMIIKYIMYQTLSPT